jgi:hypothetical protein
VIPLALLLAALDGGALVAPPVEPPPKAAARKLSPEDEEVVRYLELLENLNEAQDLELLQDLSIEQ